MYQVRIYKLRTPEVAEEYFQDHWRKHVESLKKFGIRTVAVFRETKTKGITRVIALCEYEEGADIKSLNRAYMRSSEFRSDMKGFKLYNMVGVKAYTVELDDYIKDRFACE